MNIRFLIEMSFMSKTPMRLYCDNWSTSILYKAPFLGILKLIAIGYGKV